MSLVNQNFPKDQYEIIIIDNGSKDNSYKIVMDIIQNVSADVRIGIVKENKKGAYIARNTGINISKGKIIAFTDADCIANINWLKELFAGFKSKDIGCVVGAVNPYPGKTLVEIYSKNKEILSQKQTLESKFLPYGQTANVAFRREVFENIGMFDEEMISGGDADISWMMQLKTDYKLVYRPEAIIEHHHRTTFKGLFMQQFRYGFGKILLYKKYSNYMRHNTNYNIKYNYFNMIKLILAVNIFYIRSIKRLFGLCDKYHLYEPLLSFVYMSGYALGKIYGWKKLKESFFNTL